MNIELHPKVVPILEKINFLGRYRHMCETYPTGRCQAHQTFDYKKDIFAHFPYTVKYDRKERFYGINEKFGEIEFSFNIVFRYSVVDLIWDLTVKGENYPLWGPWHMIYRLFTGSRAGFSPPGYCNAEELREILRQAFSLYEDFKKEVVDQLGEPIP